MAAELARGRLLTGTRLFIGNPWALLGYSRSDLYGRNLEAYLRLTLDATRE